MALPLVTVYVSYGFRSEQAAEVVEGVGARAAGAGVRGGARARVDGDGDGTRRRALAVSGRPGLDGALGSGGAGRARARAGRDGGRGRGDGARVSAGRVPLDALRGGARRAGGECRAAREVSRTDCGRR